MRLRRIVSWSSLGGVPADVNEEMSRPEQKCGPVDEMTMTRARTLWSISLMIVGSSSQNAGFMLFRFSGRIMRTWATWSLISTSKQV